MQRRTNNQPNRSVGRPTRNGTTANRIQEGPYHRFTAATNAPMTDLQLIHSILEPPMRNQVVSDTSSDTSGVEFLDDRLFQNQALFHNENEYSVAQSDSEDGNYTFRNSSYSTYSMFGLRQDQPPYNNEDQFDQMTLRDVSSDGSIEFIEETDFACIHNPISEPAVACIHNPISEPAVANMTLQPTVANMTPQPTNVPTVADMTPQPTNEPNVVQRVGGERLQQHYDIYPSDMRNQIRSPAVEFGIIASELQDVYQSFMRNPSRYSGEMFSECLLDFFHYFDRHFPSAELTLLYAQRHLWMNALSEFGLIDNDNRQLFREVTVKLLHCSTLDNVTTPDLAYMAGMATDAQQDPNHPYGIEMVDAVCRIYVETYNKFGPEEEEAYPHFVSAYDTWRILQGGRAGSNAMAGCLKVGKNTIFPILHRGHWSCALFSLENNRVQIYLMDSKQTNVYTHQLQYAFQLITQFIWPGLPFTVSDKCRAVPQQGNAPVCGIFTCEFVRRAYSDFDGIVATLRSNSPQLIFPSESIDSFRTGFWQLLKSLAEKPDYDIPRYVFTQVMIPMSL